LGLNRKKTLQLIDALAVDLYSKRAYRVPLLIPVLDSQLAGHRSHKPDDIGCRYFPTDPRLPPQPPSITAKLRRYQIILLSDRGTRA